MFREDRTAFKVGIISFLMVIATFSLLFWKSSLALQVTGYEITGEFPSVGGLIAGAPVRYRGIKVGKVFSITPSQESIIVKIRIKNSIEIPKNSYASVTFDGLIGERFLVMVPDDDNPGEGILEDGDRVVGESTAGLADFVEVGTQNLEETRAILQTFRKVFTSEEAENSLLSSVTEIEEIVTNLKEVSAFMSKFAGSKKIDTLIDNMVTVADSFERMSTRIEEQILNEETSKQLSESIANFSQFSENMVNLSNKFDNYLLGDGSVQEPSTAVSVFKTVSTMKVQPGAKLEYSQLESLSTYAINIDWIFQDSYIRTGFGDRINSNTDFLNFQYGLQLSEKLGTRLGLFYKEPGIALDYAMLNRWIWELEVYNLQQVEFDLTSKIKVTDNIYTLLNLRRDPSLINVYNNYVFGLSYDF